MTATIEAPPPAPSDDAPTTPRRVAFDFIGLILWAVRVTFLIIILWGLVGAITLSIEGDGLSADAWRQLTVTGLAQGSMYGLIALGYSMVYGVLGFINFAHGEVFVTGSIFGFFAADALDSSGMWDSNIALAIIIVMLVSMSSSTLLAVVIERVAYRPLRSAPRLIPLITSIGVSFFIQYALRGLFGSGFLTYPRLPETLRSTVEIAGFKVQWVQVVVIIVAGISMFGLYLFITRTKAGRAMRAVAEDKEIAGLMGINVDRTIVMTFAVGGAMAGIAGTLWALLFRQVYFLTGFLPGIKAFTAAVLGGIGNMAGAYLGGLSLGLFEALGPQVILGGLRWELRVVLLMAIILAVAVAFAVWKRKHLTPGIIAVVLITALVTLLTLVIPGLRDWRWSVVIPGLTQLKDVVAFTALVLVLIFRPTGLLGERLAVEERG